MKLKTKITDVKSINGEYGKYRERCKTERGGVNTAKTQLSVGEHRKEMRCEKYESLRAIRCQKKRLCCEVNGGFTIGSV